MVLMRGARECFFEWLWGGSRGCGGYFLLEVCQQIVRWEASYKATPFSKKFKFDGICIAWEPGAYYWY